MINSNTFRDVIVFSQCSVIASGLVMILRLIVFAGLFFASSLKLNTDYARLLTLE